MLSQQTRRAGKRAPRRLEARVEARAHDRAPQTARPVHFIWCHCGWRPWGIGMYQQCPVSTKGLCWYFVSEHTEFRAWFTVTVGHCPTRKYKCPINFTTCRTFCPTDFFVNCKQDLFCLFMAFWHLIKISITVNLILSINFKASSWLFLFWKTCMTLTKKPMYDCARGLNNVQSSAQQRSSVATAGTCPMKLSNILSDELDLNLFFTSWQNYLQNI